MSGGDVQHAGENYMLTCIVTGGEATAETVYRWLNHSVPMSNETSATLSFSPLRQTTPSSNGQYVCEAIRSGRIVRSTSEGFTVLVMGNG